ncbi:hypothetical protein E2562_024915 [Oryza meyeriana var. granulata]|uniref:Leucine-rich repeat-containing N-terminal plant-type domain-containing protein n=1 Tax=Oryza meyeriana var. granulata TaxID=110450 RepID=A0A6G1DMW1_9ORYZ|nr:hypothetical protein E2562_024915 [Oryza meyeriana var. granulata]
MPPPPVAARLALLAGEALLRWKASLRPTGGALDSWRASDASPCRWLGVSCDGRGDVVGLSITSVDLQGPLPAASLQPLAPSLRTLVLSGTNLTGVIPPELGGYGELATLDVSKNQLTGAIPAELCRLASIVAPIHGVLVLALFEAQGLQCAIKFHIPGSRCLPQAIEGLAQAEDLAFFSDNDETRGLLHIHFFIQFSIEKG